MILKILHSCRKNFSCKDFHFDSKGIGIPPLLNNFNSSIRLKKISQTSAISFTTPSAYRTVKRGQLFFLSTPSACKNFQSSTISFQEKYPTFTRMYSIGFRYGQQFGYLLFLEEHRSKRSRPLCETEWNDSEASRRKSIFCSSSRMCKGIRGTRGWKIDGTTWNSFDFDCFRRTFNATAAKVEPRFLLRRKRLLSLLFIYFFPLPFFSYGEKYNNYIVSLNRCWTRLKAFPFREGKV